MLNMNLSTILRCNNNGLRPINASSLARVIKYFIWFKCIFSIDAAKFSFAYTRYVLIVVAGVIPWSQCYAEKYQFINGGSCYDFSFFNKSKSFMELNAVCIEKSDTAPKLSTIRVRHNYSCLCSQRNNQTISQFDFAINNDSIHGGNLTVKWVLDTLSADGLTKALTIKNNRIFDARCNIDSICIKVKKSKNGKL